jgi:hypothetical protein
MITERTAEQTHRLEVARDIFKSMNGYQIVMINEKPHFFNMDIWGCYDRFTLMDGREKAPDVPEQDNYCGYCGTVGCAWGIITIHPKMKELGLEAHGFGSHSGKINGIYKEPKLADRFFGLIPDEFTYLFSPTAYMHPKETEYYKRVLEITPADVAQHFQEVLDGKFRKNES